MDVQQDAHQIAKRQQYTAIVDAQAGRPGSLVSGAESHPSYPAVAALCRKYPKQAAAFFQAFIDLKHAAEWEDLEALDLEGLEQGALRGRRKDKSTSEVVVPVSLYDTLSVSQLEAIFARLDPMPSHILLGMLAQDSTIVYYKVARGIVKPIN